MTLPRLRFRGSGGRNVGGWSAGFTLIEAMLTTALMVFVIGALATMTREWLRNWDRGFTRIQRVDLWAAGLDRIMTDLAAAEYVSGGGSDTVPFFEGSERAVTFIRTAVGPNASSSLEVVRIADESDDRGPALVRWTAPFAPKAGNPADGAFSNPVVLMRAPYPIAFSYAGPDRSWSAVWRGKPQLPRSVRVEVPGSSGRLLLSTSTVVRAELPAVCAQPNAECAADKSANPDDSIATARRR
ncbi:MAG: general secretion pathway protein GspJ [Xanthobacteraceae bacterium]|nr:general secretion pathway protein GspJ [Xanthobacteraceae bacterium]